MTQEQNVVTSVRAVLTFGDAAGRKSSFSVPRARLGKTTEEVRESMQAIIATGALQLRQLDAVTAAKGAKLVKTIRTRLI